MIKELKEIVLTANIELHKLGLSQFGWGNVSGIDREEGIIVVVPDGVSIGCMRVDDMVAMDFSGNVVDGVLSPVSDAYAYLELYKAHADLGSIAHVYSTYATAFSQAGRSIPVYGTRHANIFGGDIECLRELTKGEVSDHDRRTGMLINKEFKKSSLIDIGVCLVERQGLYAFSDDPMKAVKCVSVTEEIAKMAQLTESLNGSVKRLPSYFLAKKSKRG